MKKNVMLIAFLSSSIVHAGNNVQQNVQQVGNLELFNPEDTFSIKTRAGELTFRLDENYDPKTAEWCDTKPLQLCKVNSKQEITSCKKTTFRCVTGDANAVMMLYETALLALYSPQQSNSLQGDCKNQNYLESMQASIAQSKKNSRNQLNNANKAGVKRSPSAGKFNHKHR